MIVSYPKESEGTATERSAFWGLKKGIKRDILFRDPIRFFNSIKKKNQVNFGPFKTERTYERQQI